MIRILFGMILGAAFVYLLDARQLDDRRTMLKERVNRGKAGEYAERAEGAIQAGRDSFADAKDRVTSTVGNARDRARETVTEAKTEAHEWADASKERADSAINGNAATN